jgi:hypothetical protein
MRELEILKDFIPVAQTNLEYDPLRGAGSLFLLEKH